MQEMKKEVVEKKNNVLLRYSNIFLLRLFHFVHASQMYFNIVLDLLSSTQFPSSYTLKKKTQN